jgi:RimJ/RimL family protein N-acetyltransferase
VVEKATGRFVGEVGFADLKRELERSLAGEPEAGWVLAPWAHGRGYATEAVRAALRWGDARFAARTVCLIDPGNAASLRVAAKCGFQPMGSTRYKGAETLLFERHPR